MANHFLVHASVTGTYYVEADDFEHAKQIAAEVTAGFLREEGDLKWNVLSLPIVNRPRGHVLTEDNGWTEGGFL